MNKRGVYFFIIDVIIGVLIFLTTVLVISSFFVPKQTLSGIDQNLDMLTEDFFSLPTSALDENLTKDLPLMYQDQDDLTVDELLFILDENGSFDGEMDAIIEDLIVWLPSQFGFSYYIKQGDSTLYSRPTALGVDAENADVLVSRKKVTGIDSEFGFQTPTLSEVTIWR